MGVLALLWGSVFLWIKIALDGGLSPVQITVARCALGAGVLYALTARKRQRLPRGREVWRHLVIAAFFCNAMPFWLFSVGEQTVDSGIAGVVHATTPLWSVAIAYALGTERGLRPVHLGGLLIGFVGTIVIFAPWGQHGLTSWGSVALLGGAASYAVAFAYMKLHLTGRDSPLAISAAQLIAATGLSSLALPFDGLQSFDASATGLLAVIVLGTFATGVTFYLSYRIIEDEGPTAAATVSYLLPVVALALGAIVLGEVLDTRVVAGMLVVLIGVGMTRSRLARHEDDAAESTTRVPPDARAGRRLATPAR